MKSKKHILLLTIMGMVVLALSYGAYRAAFVYCLCEETKTRAGTEADCDTTGQPLCSGCKDDNVQGMMFQFTDGTNLAEKYCDGYNEEKVCVDSARKCYLKSPCTWGRLWADEYCGGGGPSLCGGDDWWNDCYNSAGAGPGTWIYKPDEVCVNL